MEYMVYRLPTTDDGNYTQQFAWACQSLESSGWSDRGFDPNLYRLTAQTDGLALIQQHTDSGNVWELSEIRHAHEGYAVYLVHNAFVLNGERLEDVSLFGDSQAVEAAIRDLGLEV